MYHYHHLISCRHSKMRRRYLFLAAIDMLSAFRYTFLCQREERGGIAQLGERLHGMQEVRGSIPLVSTISTLTDAREILHPFFCNKYPPAMWGDIYCKKKRIAVRCVSLRWCAWGDSNPRPTA